MSNKALCFLYKIFVVPEIVCVKIIMILDANLYMHCVPRGPIHIFSDGGMRVQGMFWGLKFWPKGILVGL